MNFEKVLGLGVEKNVISETQKEELLDLCKQTITETEPISGIVKLFYYIGGLIILCAMSFLMTDAVQHSTYIKILCLGGFYAAVFLGLGEFLWKKKEELPAGILYFLFVTIIGFIILDIEKMIGFFPHFSDMHYYDNYWELCRLPIIVLSIFTIATNAIIQRYRKISFLALPNIFCSAVIFLCLAYWILGTVLNTFEINCYSGLIFSIGLVIVAFIQDRKTLADYSMWMYLLGITGIYFSCLAIMNEYSQTNQYELIVLVLSLVNFCAGFIIQRKLLSIIGILGLIEFIIYLENRICYYNTTILMTTVLATGLIILYLGVLYNKNIAKIETFFEHIIPSKIRKYLPQNRI